MSQETVLVSLAPITLRIFHNYIFCKYIIAQGWKCESYGSTEGTPYNSLYGDAPPKREDTYI